MSINSIPANVDNRLNIDRPNILLGNQEKGSPGTLPEKQTVETSGIEKEAVDKLAQSNGVSSTLNADLAEENQKKEVSLEETEKALEIVTSFLQSTLKQVDFSSDNNAGKTVITVLDRKTQEVINQFPSEKIISMAEKIQALHQEVESISGLLIDSHV